MLKRFITFMILIGLADLGVFLRWARLRLFVLAALLTCSLFSCDDALSCAGRPIFLRWLDCFGVRDDFIKVIYLL